MSGHELGSASGNLLDVGHHLDQLARPECPLVAFSAWHEATVYESMWREQPRHAGRRAAGLAMWFLRALEVLGPAPVSPLQDRPDGSGDGLRECGKVRGDSVRGGERPCRAHHPHKVAQSYRHVLRVFSLRRILTVDWRRSMLLPGSRP